MLWLDLLRIFDSGLPHSNSLSLPAWSDSMCQNPFSLLWFFFFILKVRRCGQAVLLLSVPFDQFPSEVPNVALWMLHSSLQCTTENGAVPVSWVWLLGSTDVSYKCEQLTTICSSISQERKHFEFIKCYKYMKSIFCVKTQYFRAVVQYNRKSLKLKLCYCCFINP